MSAQVDTEVIVVGAGVVGLATARALAQLGRDVIVLERHAIGHDGASSHGRSRMFRFSYPEQLWVQRAQEALPLWRALEAEAGEPLLKSTGSLDLGAVEGQRAALAACGARFELLNGGEVGSRWPITVTGGVPALFQPDGGMLRADAVVQALLASATSAGARVLEETAADAIESDPAGVRVGDLRAGVAVVAAGAWTPSLVALDAQPTRETSTYLSLVGEGEELPVVIDTTTTSQTGFEAYGVVSPGEGLKAGLHGSGQPADPDERGDPDEVIVAQTAAWATRRFRDASPEVLRAETCLYTNIADERFVVERRGRIVVGSACSGHGFKFAPLVGAQLAALAVETL
ncbi:MAG: FAD-dependent oxidoreductase [Euzebyaceae bacterium]|nr:FAD-dependent oxidoreductase [Euzebyaceae bacterium]